MIRSRTAAVVTVAVSLALAGTAADDAAPPAGSARSASTAADAGDPEPDPGAHPDADTDAATVSPTGYRSPTDGAVLRLFDPPLVRWGRGHRGVDLAVDGDGRVRAPGAGVVSFSGRVVDRGVVTITHPDGLRSSLEPVEDGPLVGTVVAAGDSLGRVAASSHCPGRACVHWGVRRGETYLDPLDLLGPRIVVLLPDP